MLNRLVDAGNTVLVVEHHLDVIKCADWILDLGPEGGDAGGELVAEGPPEAVAQVAASYTGKFLQDFLKDGRASERPARGGPGADAAPAAATSEPGAGSAESDGSPVHYGWIVVGAAFTVLFLAYGVQYSFGLFFTALTEEFGWSRASLSGVFSLYAAAYSFLGLFAGRLTDRWGPRAVIALGGAFLGLGLALSGGIQALPPLYATYLLAAVGMSSAYVPCNATVARWFEARRGLAVGLGLSGASAGTFAGPPLVALLIAEVGWRRAYALLGVGLALSLGLLAGLFVRDPRDRGLSPYGAASRPVSATAAADGWPIRQVVRHPSFALLVAVYTTTWIPVFMPPVHLVPLARDLGLSPVVGATALSALGAGSLVGRLGMGAVSDAIGRRPTLVIALGLQTLSFVGLAGASGAATLFGAAAAFGFAYGAISALMPAVVTDFYGPAHAGSLVGLIFGLAGPAGGLGPVLAGWLFDTTGSYVAAFGLGAGLNLLALVFAVLARPPASRPG